MGFSGRERALYITKLGDSYTPVISLVFGQRLTIDALSSHDLGISPKELGF